MLREPNIALVFPLFVFIFIFIHDISITYGVLSNPKTNGIGLLSCVRIILTLANSISKLSFVIAKF